MTFCRLSTRALPPQIFHTPTKILQKARAALSPNSSSYDYLRDEIASRLVDRLYDTSRTYQNCLDFGCGSGHVQKALKSHDTEKVGVLHACDIHEAILSKYKGNGKTFVWREGDGFVIEKDSLDLVISGGCLHWINDLPGVLGRLNGLLKADGLFLGAMVGGNTLQELRISLQLAEEEVMGGVSVHVSPMVQLRDVGSLLGRAGFQLTTVDVDEIRVPYPDLWTLMKHLKGMGENNAVSARKGFMRKRVFERAAEIYKEKFGYQDPDDSGSMLIDATFHVVFMIGWKQAASQVNAKPRGSGEVSLANLTSVIGDKS